MNASYFIKTLHGDVGPFSESQVAFKLKTRQLTGEDMYWKEGNQDWLPLSMIEDELKLAPQPSGNTVGIPEGAATKPVQSVKDEESWELDWGAALILVGLGIAFYFGVIYDTAVETTAGIDVHNLQKGNNRLIGVIAGVGLAILGAILKSKSKG